MRLRLSLIIVAMVTLLLSIGVQVDAQGASSFPNIKWKYGPTTAQLGSIAKVKVPNNFVFADGDATRSFMQELGNRPTGQEVGCVAPEHLLWFLVFEYSEVGYVEDDDRDSLDSAELLQTITDGTNSDNKRREKAGIPIIEIWGWHTEPHYDSTTHNLEWAIKAKSDGESLINHNTRILGRGGVMEVTFVGDQTDLSNRLTAAKRVLKGFRFTDGNRYEQFVEGDKVAKYGLAALVAGGGAAVAAKSGLFRWLWKLIVAGVVAVGAFFKKFFGKS